MSSWDVKPDRADRELLRQASHRVFDRMVATDDQFVQAVNDMENAARDVFRGVMFVLLFLILFVAVQAIRSLLLDSGVALAWLDLSRVILGCAAVSATVVFFLLGRWFKNFSARFFIWCGRVFVNRRKLESELEKRQAMVRSVINFMRIRPLYSILLFERTYDKPVSEMLSPSLVGTIRELKNPRSSNGFLVLRRIIEVKPWPVYVGHWFRSPHAEGRKSRLQEGSFLHRFVRKRDYNYFVRARGRRNDLKVSFLLSILNAEMRDERDGGIRWRREYVTNRDRQSTALFDTGDLHTRFRTNSPHYRWPNADNGDSIGETSTYRAILCHENPCELPLFVLNVRNVVNRFESVIEEFFEECRGPTDSAIAERQKRLETVIQKLMKTNVRMFGKFSHRTLQATSEAGGVEPEPMLRDLSLTVEQNDDPENVLAEGHFRDWGLRWDPNLVDWHQLTADTDGETSMAFAVLIEAIDQERANAQMIVLKRGDCLLVDNLRCLVARQEAPPRFAWRALLAIPQEWWLAGIYGFRRSLKSSREPFEENYRQLAPEDAVIAPPGSAPERHDVPPIPEYMTRRER